MTYPSYLTASKHLLALWLKRAVLALFNSRRYSVGPCSFPQSVGAQNPINRILGGLPRPPRLHSHTFSVRYGDSLRLALFIGALHGGVFHCTATAVAQHPIDVERKTVDGEYLKALVAYDKMPKRISTIDSSIAAAKSAWALSLPTRAIAEFDLLLQDKKLTPAQRANIYLSRAVIDYQEGRYQVASHYAEKSLELKAAPSIRSKTLLLWGESFEKLGSYGAAETKFIEALEGALPEEAPEIEYRLGICRLKLGKPEEARSNFEHVPLNHERTPDAIRYLATIAIETGRYTDATFWLKKGRTEYPDNFLDSWVDYALLKVAANDRDAKMVREIRDAAEKKYPPSDPWFTLLNASAEQYAWESVKVKDAHE